MFTYDELREFLLYTKNVSRIVPLCEWDHSNVIILRHDVDFDIDKAYKLAQIEAELDIRSTFFVMLTSYTYNPLTKINSDKIREMAEIGFEIGLHFDPMVYGEHKDSKLQDMVCNEASMLSQVSGKPVRSVSLHNPSVYGKYPMFSGFLNAYDSRIFSDETYMSDSCMNFRGKDPYEFIKKAENSPIQILLHPLHYSENGDKYPDIFFKYIKNYVNDIDEVFSVNSAYTRQKDFSDLFSYICKEQMK